MDKLKKGASEFRKKTFPEQKELYMELASGQEPHTLFITCSDSRIVPSMITGTGPGELFVVRNIANIVPPLHRAEDFPSAASALEYAILELEVERILVCGHSNCGGCRTLISEVRDRDSMPHTMNWLDLAAPVREDVRSSDNLPAGQTRTETAEKRNILLQMEHLLSYPFIRDRLEAGALSIEGWYYILEKGELYAYHPEKQLFSRID